MYPNSISIKFDIISSVYLKHLFNRFSITSEILLASVSNLSISGIEI